MTKKTIQVSGLTKNQREKALEKIKAKYEKKGYIFLEYIDDGMTKSTAIFNVEESLLKKEKISKILKIGIVVIILIMIVLMSSDNPPTYSKYKDTTLKEAKVLPLSTINIIASGFVKEKNIDPIYNEIFNNCLGEFIYAKNDTFTLDKMLGWCYTDYTSNNGKMKQYYNTVILMSKFSPWDGSYAPLEKLIKNSMNDVTSYEHVKTNYRLIYSGVTRAHMILTAQFRGKNGFGSMVLQTVTAKVDAITNEMYDVQ